MLEHALRLLDEVGRQGCDAVCLPELVNVFGMETDAAKRAADHDVLGPLLNRVADLARTRSMYILVPVLERRGDRWFNCTKIFDRHGRLFGEYDKMHLTDAERSWYNAAPGGAYTVFTADWGTFGVMTCYDSYFPEVARTLALDGADVIFFPSWRSGPSEIVMEVQLRARAIDNFVFVVRSSFGYERTVAWRPGMLFGRSCIIDREGTTQADAGHHAGFVRATVDLGRPRLMDVLDDGGDVQDLKALTWRDRRPETYGRLLQR